VPLFTQSVMGLHVKQVSSSANLQMCILIFTPRVLLPSQCSQMQTQSAVLFAVRWVWLRAVNCQAWAFPHAAAEL